MVQLQLTGLYAYPVKSLKGIALERAVLTPLGLAHDRRWMVVRPDGRFVTQRDEPRLALIHTRLEEDGVVLWREGSGEYLLPFESSGGAAVATRVWQDDCEASDEGAAASRWLTAAVGSDTELRLVRMAPGFRRPQGQPQRYGADTTTVFADSAPFLVANEASLASLNAALEAGGHEAVPMNRFRPNLVISGLEAFAEHRSGSLLGDGFSIEFVDHCVRCLVTTVDQQTGERHPGREPYLTLRRINPAPVGRPSPAFGQNARLGLGDGHTIHLGAALKVND